MKTKARKILTVLAAVGLAGALSAGAASCASEPSSGRDTAEKQRNQGIEQVRANQPVKPMPWSPTLNTIDRWASTWGQEGKVSYVYMQRADGEFAGYYVLSGLPVNYCVSATPVDEEVPVYGSGPNPLGTAPALDSAYYGGCDENRYYGFDAVSGQYIEYTDGFVLTAVLSDSPLPLDKQPRPFGSSIEDVKKGK